MKKITLSIIILIFISLIGKSVFDYYKFKSYSVPFENMSFLINSSYDIYFYRKGKNPDNKKEFNEHIKNVFYENNHLDFDKEAPEIFLKNGISFDVTDSIITFYVSNRENINKYKAKKYYWSLDSISYFDYIFKPLKIALFQTDKLNMCNFLPHNIKLYKNSNLITKKSIIQKVYNSVKNADCYIKGKSSDFFYLYGKKEKSKFHFSILCNKSNYNYNNLVKYADSVYNECNEILQNVDEIYIPFNSVPQQF